MLHFLLLCFLLCYNIFIWCIFIPFHYSFCVLYVQYILFTEDSALVEYQAIFKNGFCKCWSKTGGQRRTRICICGWNGESSVQLPVLISHFLSVLLSQLSPLLLSSFPFHPLFPASFCPSSLSPPPLHLCCVII